MKIKEKIILYFGFKMNADNAYVLFSTFQILYKYVFKFLPDNIDTYLEVPKNIMKKHFYTFLSQDSNTKKHF